MAALTPEGQIPRAKPVPPPSSIVEGMSVADEAVQTSPIANPLVSACSDNNAATGAAAAPAAAAAAAEMVIAGHVGGVARLNK